jgi:hypothetical protein
MSVKTVSVSPGDYVPYHVERAWNNTSVLQGDEVFPVYLTSYAAHGTFANVVRNTAGTTTVTTPKANGSMVITDLIINTEKRAGGEVEIQFTDGTNTVIIFKAFCTDAPTNLVLGAAGKFQGWTDARIDLVVTGNTDCSVTLGYVKLNSGQPFSEWDAAR